MVREIGTIILAAIAVCGCEDFDSGIWTDRAACGAAAENRVENNPFAELAHARVPAGTPLRDAKQSFVALGFECSETIAYPGPTTRHYCDRAHTASLIPPIDRRWVVSFDLDEDENVRALRTGCGVTGL